MPLLPDPVNAPNVKLFYLPKPDKDENGDALPVEKQAWVKMDMQPMAGADITAGFTNTTDPFGTFLVRRIVEWNFTEADGKPTPITYENVLRIGQDNIIFLAQQPLESVAPLTDEQKKNIYLYYDASLAVADGKDRELPPIPQQYFILLWRRKFHETYLSAMHTPLEVMQQDFEMVEIEAEVDAMRAATQKQHQKPQAITR